MRYAELFAGAGGLSLGLDRAGFSCAWHAEIADFPRRVLKHRWPDVPLYGDVSELNGRELIERHGPIDLLSGGSPCQDLSVAGKRAGMAEGSGTRSSLFYEQLRLWNETEAEFLLWENVDGARSSNKGKDFGRVLSSIVGADVFVPSDGWRSGGVAVGPSAIAAWRVLDAQFFGVPQRRRRIFVLCSRTGRVDPAEILSLSEGLRGDTAPSGETGEGSAGSAGNGAETASGVVSVDALNHSVDDIMHTFRSGSQMSGAVFGGVLSFGWQNSPSQGDSVSEAMTPALDKSKTPAVLAFAENDRAELRLMDIASALSGGGGKPGQGYPAIIAPTFSPGAHPGGFNGQDTAMVEAITRTHGIPRRLMPIECERLMSWPDNWTNVSENGKPASDAARYKACGNGVVSHCVQWIGERLQRRGN